MSLAGFDPDLHSALAAERKRQEEFAELIASENYASARVLEAQGSCLTNKYADGYPGARTYSGCEHVDVVETLARERACRLFSAGYANVQPYSGTQANAAAYAALMQPGDKLLGMSASHGGHITHGSPSSFAGRLYDVVQYGIDPETSEVDFDAVWRLAREHRPRVIVAGFSAYPRVMDWSKFREIADDVGAYLVVDMAHAAGLVAAGLFPNPVSIADVCTSTTHKTLRGPRGGLILARRGSELAGDLDRAVYPTVQGGPLMHVIAAKAVAFREALEPEFVDYQRQVLGNAQRLARCLADRGVGIVTGGTDNHMVLADLEGRGLTAADAEQALERARIAVGSIRLPRARAEQAATGLRLGTPAVTTRGFKEPEIEMLAAWITEILDDPSTAPRRVGDAVLELCRAHPVYGRDD
jgi:glycine hydroxymethyltransferase